MSICKTAGQQARRAGEPSTMSVASSQTADGSHAAGNPSAASAADIANAASAADRSNAAIAIDPNHAFREEVRAFLCDQLTEDLRSAGRRRSGL
ncbi:MAG: hypothetical protein JWQ11_1629 [Rhizobacter sp.]|nr:hypothetical protein [Rhizobacter sp.]